MDVLSRPAVLSRNARPALRGLPAHRRGGKTAAGREERALAGAATAAAEEAPHAAGAALARGSVARREAEDGDGLKLSAAVRGAALRRARSPQSPAAPARRHARPARARCNGQWRRRK